MAGGTQVKQVTRRHGRPPRHRAMHAYGPPLEPLVIQRLVAMAEQAGVPTPGEFAQLVVGAAHGYRSQWAPPVHVESVVDVSQLHLVVRDMPGGKFPAIGDGVQFKFRLDQVLADKIHTRCDEQLDMPYSHYMRRLLHAATGTTAEELRQAQGWVQEPLDALGKAAS